MSKSVALESIPPLLMAGVRWVVAGSLLIAFVRIRGEPLPERRQWLPLAVRGVLLIGVGNGAVVWAEQTVASGLTAVLVAVNPFWMVSVEALSERAGRLRWLAPAVCQFPDVKQPDVR